MHNKKNISYNNINNKKKNLTYRKCKNRILGYNKKNWVFYDKNFDNVKFLSNFCVKGKASYATFFFKLKYNKKKELDELKKTIKKQEKEKKNKKNDKEERINPFLFRRKKRSFRKKAKKMYKSHI